MKLLAVDTATEACSVALWLDGEVIERFEVAGREHSTRLPPILNQLMADAGVKLAQIDGLIAGIGPGSFAGVRIGVAFVKGLALGIDRPAAGTSSLAMLAQGALRVQGARQALAVIDARMNEVYAGTFAVEKGVMSLTGAEVVAAAGQVRFESMTSEPFAAVGTGWAVAPEALLANLPMPPQWIVADALPHAQDAISLARTAFENGQVPDASRLTPNYLRNRVALTQIEQTAARIARRAGERTD